MVSFHKALAESPRSAVTAELEASSKRKWEESLPVEFLNAQTEAKKRKSTSDNRQLYPGSGINMNTPEDPDNSPAPPSSTQISLDLELNLTFDQSQRNKADNYNINNMQNSSSPKSFRGHHDIYSTESSEYKKDSEGDISNSSSWRMSSSEAEHREMVATVCMRCHMLVMLRKSSPACPNCKFMHPPDQNTPTFLKRKCSLLC